MRVEGRGLEGERGDGGGRGGGEGETTVTCYVEGSANPVGSVLLVRVVALDLQKQTIHTSGCGGT